MAAIRVRARAGLCSLPGRLHGVLDDAARAGPTAPGRISATAGWRGALDGQLDPDEQQVGFVQPRAQHRDGLPYDVPVDPPCSSIRWVRSAMSGANCAVTYSVSRVSSASRVRMYAEQLPSGSPASASTARWVSPRRPLRATTRTAAGEQLLLPCGEGIPARVVPPLRGSR